MDMRGVVQSWVPYITNNPSWIFVFSSAKHSLSCSRTRTLCLFVSYFSLFVLSLLCVYHCLYLCCLCIQSYLCFLSFTRCLNLWVLSLIFQLSLSFLICCFSVLCHVVLCLPLFLQPCRATSLFVSVFTPKHTKKTHKKQHNKTYIHTCPHLYVYICK